MAKKLRRLFAALLSLTLILSGFNGITAHAALLSSDECSTHSDRGHFRWSGNFRLF